MLEDYWDLLKKRWKWLVIFIFSVYTIARYWKIMDLYATFLDEVSLEGVYEAGLKNIHWLGHYDIPLHLYFANWIVFGFVLAYFLLKETDKWIKEKK